MSRVAALVALCALTCASPLSTFAFAQPQTEDDRAGDVARLLDGVGSIASPGLPGPLCVTGADAFAVWTGRDSSNIALPVVAAARHGDGRVIAFGHTGYFGKQALDTGDTSRLLVNATHWLGGNHARVACWRSPELVERLRESEVRATALEQRDWMAELERFDVVFLSPTTLDDGELTLLRQWVAEGGGLGLVGLGWGWQQLNPDARLSEDHPGNRLTAPLGIVWSDGSFARIDDSPATSATLRRASAHEALQRLTERDDDEVSLDAVRGVVLASAVRAVPADDASLLAPLEAWLAGRDLPLPTADDPLGPDRVAARLAIVARHRRDAALAPDELEAAPDAALFPGSVPESAQRRAGARVRVRGAAQERVSTGLYVAPGEAITVHADERALAAGLRVRIGAHSDRLWNRPAWERHPEISRTRALDRAEVRFANPHGGALYFELQHRIEDPLELRVDGAVTAPHFVLGRTTAKEWKVLRRAQAPWAELVSEHVALSVPSSVVRGLDDPTALLETWDRILATYSQLDGRPLFERPERFVPDVDISAGYMHSGYPIMTHLDAAPWLVDRDRLLGRPEPQVWGLWHELGHNRQRPDWTFDGTVEVTCNLYTLHVLDRISDVRPIEHPRIAPLAKRFDEHRAAGADFATWKRDPFLALYMYVQLQEAFGWESYRRVFERYEALPVAARPANDDAKRDSWLVCFSEVVERDLSGFFEAWGVPTSEAARESVAHFEPWMP